MSMETLKTIITADIANRGARPADSLVSGAAEAALKACIIRLRNDGHAPDAVALVPIVHEQIRIALPSAIADLREAVNANMHQIGGMTFMASMALAGVAAALQYESELVEAKL